MFYPLKTRKLVQALQFRIPTAKAQQWLMAQSVEENKAIVKHKKKQSMAILSVFMP